jgi:hypothetical protein
MSHASNPRMQSDRFAREIMAILALGYAARLRRLSFIGRYLGGAIRAQWSEG